jgi:ABC-type sugar transport system ATPase subunit
MTIELRNITKCYGATVALDSVSVTFEPGRVHALVGENGAGKSTCLGIAGGHTGPSSGAVLINDEPVRMTGPRDGAAHGITTIHQELSIIGELSAVQNVFLGAEARRVLGFADNRMMRAAFDTLRERLDVRIDPDALAHDLSVSDRQMLEIMKALVREPAAVLFDEPTASLGPREREKLYAVIRDLRSSGTTVAFVSHNLDEVLTMSDTVSVFRDGRLIDTSEASQWTRASLTEVMVGRAVERGPAQPRSASAGVPVLRVHDVTDARTLGVSFEIGAGEVVGIAGLVGSGRSNLLRLIAGDQPAERGTMSIEGKALSWPGSVREARRRGIALLHEDRKDAGILPEATSRANILLGNFSATSRRGLVSDRRDAQRVRDVATEVGLAHSRLGTPVQFLSGGNQQKTLLARLLLQSPRVVLADEPARGVDIGAKSEIFSAIHRLAIGGSAVLMVSSEFEELEEHCHRVLVMWHGQIVAELSGAEITRQRMIAHSFGPEGTQA